MTHATTVASVLHINHDTVRPFSAESCSGTIYQASGSEHLIHLHYLHCQRLSMYVEREVFCFCRMLHEGIRCSMRLSNAVTNFLNDFLRVSRNGPHLASQITESHASIACASPRRSPLNRRLAHNSMTSIMLSLEARPIVAISYRRYRVSHTQTDGKQKQRDGKNAIADTGEQHMWMECARLAEHCSFMYNFVHPFPYMVKI